MYMTNPTPHDLDLLIPSPLCSHLGITNAHRLYGGILGAAAATGIGYTRPFVCQLGL